MFRSKGDATELSQIVDKYLSRIFKLLPAEDQKDRKSGDAISFTLPSKKTYQSRAELAADKDYPKYAVRCIYSALLIVKESGIFAEPKWNTMAPDAKAKFLGIELSLKGGATALKYKRAYDYLHYVDPRMYLIKKGIKKGKSGEIKDFYEIPEQERKEYKINQYELFEGTNGTWRLNGLGDEYQQINVDTKQTMTLKKIQQDKEAQDGKEFKVKLDSSWLPHIVDDKDDITLNLAFILENFLLELLDKGPVVPEFGQVKDKLNIIGTRMINYVYEKYSNFINQLQKLRQQITESNVDEILRQYRDIQAYCNSPSLNRAKMGYGQLVSALDDDPMFNDLLKRVEVPYNNYSTKSLELEEAIKKIKAERFLKEFKIDHSLIEGYQKIEASLELKSNSSDDLVSQYLEMKAHHKYIAGLEKKLLASPLKEYGIEAQVQLYLPPRQKNVRATLADKIAMFMLEEYIEKQYTSNLKIEEALTENNQKLAACTNLLKQAQKEKYDLEIKKWHEELSLDFKELPQDIGGLRDFHQKLNEKIAHINNADLKMTSDKAGMGNGEVFDEIDQFLEPIHAAFKQDRQAVIEQYRKKEKEIQDKIFAYDAADSKELQRQIHVLQKSTAVFARELKNVKEAEKKLKEIEKITQDEHKAAESRYAQLQADVKRKEDYYKEAQAQDVKFSQDEVKLTSLQALFLQKEFKAIAELFKRDSDYKLILGNQYSSIRVIVDRNVATGRSAATAWSSWLSNIGSNDNIQGRDLVGVAIYELQRKKPNLPSLKDEIKSAQQVQVAAEYPYQEELKAIVAKVDTAKQIKNKKQEESYEKLNQEYVQSQRDLHSAQGSSTTTELEDEKHEDTYEYHDAHLKEMQEDLAKRLNAHCEQEYQRIIAKVVEELKNESNEIDQVIFLGSIDEMKLEIRSLKQMVESIPEVKKTDTEEEEDSLLVNKINLLMQTTSLEEVLNNLHKKLLEIQTLKLELNTLERSLNARDYKEEAALFRNGGQDYIEQENKFYVSSVQRIGEIGHILSESKLTIPELTTIPYIQRAVAECSVLRDSVNQRLQDKKYEWETAEEIKPYKYLASKNSFSAKDVRLNLNNKNVSHIQLSDVHFAIKEEDHKTDQIMQNVQFDHAHLTRCWCNIPMNQVSFRGATLTGCIFRSFKGAIFDDDTKLDWGKHAKQILTDNLVQAPLDSKDHASLAELIDLVHRKNNQVFNSDFILLLIRSAIPRNTSVISLENQQAIRDRIHFISEHMIPKMNSLKDLVKLHALLVGQPYQYLRPGRFSRDHRFDDIVRVIQDSARQLFANSDDQALTPAEQDQLNGIMNYGKFHPLENAREEFYNARLSSKVKDPAHKITVFKNLAQQYDQESKEQLQHTRFFRNSKARDYRRKLFVAALNLLNDNKNMDIKDIKDIQNTIRFTEVTHVGATLEGFGSNRPKYRIVKIPQEYIDHHLTYDSIPDDKKQKIVVWGKKVEGSEGDDPRNTYGTTLGGFLMDRICENLILVKQNSQSQDKFKIEKIAKIKKEIAEDLHQLHRHYSGLPKLVDYEAQGRSLLSRFGK